MKNMLLRILSLPPLRGEQEGGLPLPPLRGEQEGGFSLPPLRGEQEGGFPSPHFGGSRRGALMILVALLSTTAFSQEEITVYDSALGKSEVIDVPEGMSAAQMEALYKDYHVSQLLTTDPSCRSTDTNPEFDRDTYVRRLSRLPNVIEMPYNDIVRQFIDRYMVRGRRSLPYLLSACNFYMPIFEEALEAYQLPLELKYLPIIESALNPSATSRAGAGGLWQFMVGTAKIYGLEVNSIVDERRDPVKSSYAAAHYLKDLYGIFNNWALVLAAYNCGPQNVLKAIKREGSEETDYWKIYPYLPKETRGYVPAFIAANYVANYYCEHGICPAACSLPAATDTVVISRNVHFDQIVAMCGVTEDEVRALNPQYRTGLIQGEARPSNLRLRPEAIAAFVAAGDSIYNYKSESLFNRTEVEVSESAVKQAKASRHAGKQFHKVRKGDTLGALARKYHTTVKAIQRLNGIRGNNIAVGKRIRVK